jgi:hypothetical protein
MGFRKKVVPQRPNYFPFIVISIIVIGLVMFLANKLGA